MRFEISPVRVAEAAANYVRCPRLASDELGEILGAFRTIQRDYQNEVLERTKEPEVQRDYDWEAPPTLSAGQLARSAAAEYLKERNTEIVYRTVAFCRAIDLALKVNGALFDLVGVFRLRSLVEGHIPAGHPAWWERMLLPELTHLEANYCTFCEHVTFDEFMAKDAAPSTDLRVELAAKFLRDPPSVYEYFNNLVNEALELLEWKDAPGTDISCTYLSPEATEKRVRDWFEKFNGFVSGVELAISKTSNELREYLVGQFVEADPERWRLNGKKVLDVKGLPESVVWAEIKSHGILPSNVRNGLHNMRAAMFRGLEQERGTPIYLGDDPEELSYNYSDVVVYMFRLRDRLFLDDALNRELQKNGQKVAANVGDMSETIASRHIDGLPHDGPDQSECVFRWKGRTVEGFTSTGIDVLKAMWEMLSNSEHRVRRSDVATFLPERMATWNYDPNLKNFSKYQTEIRKAFEAAQMPFPWEFNARTKHYVKTDVYREVDGR